MWPTGPQAAAGEEPTSAVCDLVVLTKLEVKMSLRNVIYYNSSNDQISLSGIAQLPYTDVIIANLQPTSPSNLTLQGYGPAFDSNLKSNVRALKNAGKNVLISFGGAEDNL